MCSLAVLVKPADVQAASLQEINGGIYSVNDDGSLGTGWISYNGYLYYFNTADGKMQTGWINDNGTWYYCDTQGRKCGNGYSPDGRYLDENGVMVDATQYFTPEQVTLNPTSGLYTLVGITPRKPRDPVVIRSDDIIPMPDGLQYYRYGGWNEALPLTDYTTLSQTRNQVFQTEVSLIGTPYLWGGSDPAEGFDCSGFVMYTLHQAAGVSMPHNSEAQMGAGTEVTMSEMRPGDVLYFGVDRNSIDHAALYAGNGWMIETKSGSNGSHVDWTKLHDTERPVGIRNQIGD